MTLLSLNFLKNCRTDNGFIYRGENMTRIETFVDAAFAFAMTMLIISLDKIPNTIPELFEAARDIPAFLLSGFMIGLIWSRHSQWSRHFGLEDALTIFLSLCLVMLVLIFIYPLKLVFIGLTHWLSAGYLSPNLASMNMAELSSLFIYFSVGFFSLSLIFYFLNVNVLKQAKHLNLTEFETYECRTDNMRWLALGLTSLVSIGLAKTMPGLWVTSAGFIYFASFFTSNVIIAIRAKKEPSKTINLS